MRLKWLLCLTLASTGLSQKSSPATGEMLGDALRSATLPIEVTSQGGFADAGGKLITDAIDHARFVLLGETHFSRETPQFAAAVCKVMRPDAYAVEAGPSAAVYVQTILKNPDRKAFMQKRERTYPANMAFLNNEQENDLAAKCAVSGRANDVSLWGLDQEFLGAASVLLQQMYQEPNGPKATAAIRLALDENKRSEVRAQSTGDFMQLFLVSASDADINSLQNAVIADGTQKSREIMREFTQSRHIYQLNAAGSPESNSERASLLKQHFLQNYRVLQGRTPEPRILLKFGDNHMWKGFNDLHQLDLGDYIAELASVEQVTSLHIQVIAAKGTLAGLGGYAKPLTTESFVLADVPEYAWLEPLVDLLPTNGSRSEGVVLDLRKLRFRKLAMSPEWKHLVYGYDLLVVLPAFTPANLYQ